jgi:hypothetical protein
MQEDRWVNVKDFISAWHRPLGPEDGYSEVEIRETEARLGVKFPEALREWYGFAGKWYAKTQGQDKQLPLSELMWEEDVLVFHVENQSVCQWAIRRESFDQADPPVEDVANGVRFAERLTDFMFGALCKEIYAGAFGERENEGLEGHGKGFAQMVAFLEKTFSVWQATSGAEQIYANHEALAMLSSEGNDGFWLFLLAKTEALEEQYFAPLSDSNTIAWEPWVRERMEEWA